MSNTTSIGDRAICEELSCVQLGSASKPVQTAYINNVIPTPAESLQNVCDVGNTTTTTITCNDLTASAGNVVATAGDFVATAGKAEIESNITTKAGNFTADVGNFVATAGNFTATAGNVVASVGQVESQQLKLSNFDSANSSQVSPQQPPFTAPNQPDLTGKSKGAYWIYDAGSATIQFIVETGIVDCTLNATTFISFNQYNTATPRRLLSYRIGQAGIAGADRSKLVISCTFDGIVPSTDPVRVCLMVYPDA